MKSSRALLSMLAVMPQTDLESVEMDSLKRPAPRPRNSRMQMSAFEANWPRGTAVLEGRLA